MSQAPPAGRALVSFHARAGQWLLQRVGIEPTRRNIDAVVLGTSLAFFAVFAWRFLPAITGEAPSEVAGWAIALAGTWLVIGPTVMCDGEIEYRDVLDLLRENETQGWERKRIEEAVTWINGTYAWIQGAVTVTMLGFFLLTWDGLAPTIGIEPSVGNLVVGTVVVAWLALGSGSGVWGVLVTIETVRRTTGRPEDSELRWNPLRSRPIIGLEEMMTIAWKAAFYFTLGAVMVPVTVDLLDAIDGPGQLVLWSFLAVLLFGGVAIYSVPAWHAGRVRTAARDRCLAQYATQVEDGIARVESDPDADIDAEAGRIGLMLSMHREIREHGADVHTGRRVLSLVMLPSAAFAEELVKAVLPG